MENNKYQKFVIYKIYQKSEPSMVYIGSSTNFKRRKSQHKKNISNRRSKAYHYPLYQYIRNQGGWENFDMVIYLDYPCNSKNEGLTKETEIIKLLNSPLNSMVSIKQKIT
jgi:predicted GIY-YIG superfamily endonuclease